MADKVYKILDLVGSSEISWEDAARNVIVKAAETITDIRIAEVAKLDLKIENGKIMAYRARVMLSFKYGSTGFTFEEVPED